MPYIKTERRLAFDTMIDRLLFELYTKEDNSGEVVYIFYKILKCMYGNGNFESRSNALKVLEATKMEYYRRVMVPYEREKIQTNGDVT